MTARRIASCRLTEPKQTVEKAVRENHLSQNLQQSNRQARHQKTIQFQKKETCSCKREKASPSEIEFRRDVTLIITEKPQAALKIASALGNARKYSENNVPFYELTRANNKNNRRFSCRSSFQSYLRRRGKKAGTPFSKQNGFHPMSGQPSHEDITNSSKTSQESQ